MAAKQKVAIVTGAAKGIGKIITSCLLSKSYKVFVFDINSAVGQETTGEFQERYGENSATFIRCDVSNKTQFTEAFNNAVENSGHISLMVNNTGILNEHDYERCIAINVDNPKLESVDFMSICPGPVDTDLFKYADENSLDPVAMKEAKAIFAFIRPEAFEEAFWQLITEGTNGSILKITTSGIEYLVNPPIAGVK